jgi:hypothetical protein
MTEWIGTHVFYGREQSVLLLECIAPALAELARDHAIHRYFFVRYWEGGPHVRLRVEPAEGAEQRVKELLESRIQAFLVSKPVFFDLPEGSQVWARRNFILEYGEQELYRKYGPEGIITTYPENTLHHFDYEPEVDRYGGPAGMEVSERHFHLSSEMVLDRLTWDNMHIKGVRLAQTITIMVAFASAFLGTEVSVARFFKEYARFWYVRFLGGTAPDLDVDVMPRTELALPKVSDRIRRMICDVGAGSMRALTRKDLEWAEHARKLREELTRLIRDGRLAVSTQYMDASAPGISDELKHLLALLFSYIHMTNNRLGVALTEEISTAYLIYRTLGTGTA